MIEKIFRNADMGIELTSFIDDQQNVWFRGKDIAKILGYSDTKQAIRKHVSAENKIIQLSRQQVLGVSKRSLNPDYCPVEMKGQQNDTRGKWSTFINEPGFYELVFSSKLETVKRFRQWVITTVLSSIPKFGQYKLFNNPYNKMIMIGSETDLHYKVVDMIRRFYPDSILVAGLGENQDTEDKRLDSYTKRYMKGQADLIILNYHKDFIGLGMEFKSPTGNYYISEALKGLDSSNNIDIRINITTFFNFPDMFRRFIRHLQCYIF